MPATTTAQTSKTASPARTRGATKTAAAQRRSTAKPAAQKPPAQQPAAQKPPEASAPTVTVEAVPVTYYRPTVRTMDGKTIVCEHRYLHETAKMAEACGRRMARAGTWVK